MPGLVHVGVRHRARAGPAGDRARDRPHRSPAHGARKVKDDRLYAGCSCVGGTAAERLSGTRFSKAANRVPDGRRRYPLDSRFFGIRPCFFDGHCSMDGFGSPDGLICEAPTQKRTEQAEWIGLLSRGLNSHLEPPSTSTSTSSTSGSSTSRTTPISTPLPWGTSLLIAIRAVNGTIGRRLEGKLLDFLSTVCAVQVKVSHVDHFSLLKCHFLSFSLAPSAPRAEGRRP